MKKNKGTVIVLAIALVVLLVGAGLLVVLQGGLLDGEKVEAKSLTYNKEGYQTFADFTTVEAFKEVPALVKEGTIISDAEDYGSDNYLISVDGTVKEDYDAYLKLLEECGFKKHSDNGEEGMAGYIYTANYTKGQNVLTITHMSRFDKTTISASNTMKLSEYLVYKEDYVKNIVADKKTKVHMLELNSNGNSFVIELRNGHFVVEDGGGPKDAPYLLDYLDELTPGDEIPVIEAWFISHSHSDHHGVLQACATNLEYQSRIRVNGVYFVEPGTGLIELYTGTEHDPHQTVWFIKQAAKVFKNEDGGPCEFYRPQLGQRYYFCDTSIDVVYTLEQMKPNAFTLDYNDTSLWLMHNIEGQTFLHGGDGAKGQTASILQYFDKSYFDVDVFAALHHGINVYNSFTDFMTVDTLLYTSWRNGSIWEDGTWKEAAAENEYLRSVVKEYYHRGDGTVILTFPYTLGTAEITEPCDWRYNPSKKPERGDWTGAATK